jgi:DNA invertase Pin-like site-specific DNA recombinase
MIGKRIAYVRVSTPEQNPDRQLEGIELDRKFVEFCSAKSTDRPELKIMLEYVRSGDTVLVHSMDRLARNLKDLKAIVDNLVAKDVKVKFMKENLEFSSEKSAVATLVLHLMGAFAEFEHAFILERQREGIEIAKLRGRYSTRKRKMASPEVLEKIRADLQTRKTKTKIAEEIGISRQLLHFYLKNYILVEDKK